ncbi:MAG: hypothetical protein C0511_15280 [Hyphomicrobium sp.]|nr:hypothetical protein [Hyphomicrobium sp.]
MAARQLELLNDGFHQKLELRLTSLATAKLHDYQKRSALECRATDVWSHARLVSKPNVRGKSDTRTIELLVFFLVPTFAPNGAAEGSKCRNRNTSVAPLTFGPRPRLVSKPNVRGKSDTRTIELLVFFLVPTFAQNARPSG